MRATQIHTRIIQHPFASLIQGARLDSYLESGRNLIIEIQGFERTTSNIFERDGKLFEHARGYLIPLRLVFSNLSKLNRDDFFKTLASYAPDDPMRTIGDMLSWQQPKRNDTFHLFGMRGPIDAGLNFYAKRLVWENPSSESKSIAIERSWSPPPPMPGRLVPQPKHLHRQFGGDPITIRLNKLVHRKRLFIGGLEYQFSHRPHVDAVLNLGEEPSRWADGKNLHPADRAVNKGEGEQGMTVEEIREEAGWVIERLKNDQRVLVHCVAGMNRSSTICCAILILLEDLTAEQSLERVREHHPWARPDSNHWLALRWLAETEFQSRH